MPPRCLADVEWQLVMHFLPSTELLCLARCSIQLSQCASQPFAWLHTEARVELTALQLGSKLASKRCLFASAPLVFHWLPPFGRNSEMLSKGQIDRLLKIPFRPQQLQSLDCTAFRPGAPAMWRLMLADRTVLPSLHALMLPGDSCSEVTVDEEAIRLIAALPMLRTLQLHSHALDPVSIAPLTQAPSLTSLHINDIDRPDRSRLELIAACPHLRSVTLHKPCFTGSLFRSFFASAAIRRLRCLTLHDWSAAGWRRYGEPDDPILPADLHVALSSLVELLDLTLSACGEVDALMPHLLCPPVLERVVFQIAHVSPSFSWKLGTMQLSSSVPDNRLLQSLLKDKPLLRCVMELTLTHTRAKHEPSIREWAQTLLDEFSDRFALHIV